MKRRSLMMAVGVGAAAALIATVGYAVAGTRDSGWGYGPMMNGAGYSMMRGDGHPGSWYLQGAGPVSTIPAARAQAQRFGDTLGLKAAEVIQFSDNFYVRLDDHKGPATEVLVDPRAGTVTLEYGPAMMWNTRYGMMRTGTVRRGGGMMGGSGYGMMGRAGNGAMSGMMGSYGGHPTVAPNGVTGPVDAAQARVLADHWLSREGTGETAGPPDTFPGYYTMETLKNGAIAGMISVNRTTGALWYHWWHGRFLAMAE